MHVLVKEIYDMVPLEGDIAAAPAADSEAEREDVEAAHEGKGGNTASKIIDRMVSNDSKPDAKSKVA
jgi:hypothetical protein